MNSPLYSVGQHVAVSYFYECACPTIISLPETTVVRAKQCVNPCCHVCDTSGPHGWYYEVAGASAPDGNLFPERCLRPIQPGEYLTDSAPQKLETPTQEEAGTTGSEPGRDRAKP